MIEIENWIRVKFHAGVKTPSRARNSNATQSILINSKIKKINPRQVKEPDDLKGLNQLVDDVINDGGKLISKNEKELAKIKDETKHDAEQVRKLAKERFSQKYLTGSPTENHRKPTGSPSEILNF